MQTFVWLLVNLTDLAGMYNLWWQRERVLYQGKSIQQQREDDSRSVIEQLTGKNTTTVFHEKNQDKGAALRYSSAKAKCDIILIDTIYRS